MSLIGGKTFEIINFLSGSNNISFSWNQLNGSISYPHTSPLNENIVPVFIVSLSFKNEYVIFGSFEVEVNPQNVFLFPILYGTVLLFLLSSDKLTWQVKHLYSTLFSG